MRELMRLQRTMAGLVVLGCACLSSFAQSHQLLPASLAVAAKIDTSGNFVTTDSFDSGNTNLFPGGLYNATNALDHGDMISVSGATNSIVVGNSNIKGTVHTAPGGTVSIGPAGSVGDASWVNSGQHGIEPGHFNDDVIGAFPDATLADTGGTVWIPAVPGSYVVNGVTYKYILSSMKFWY